MLHALRIIMPEAEPGFACDLVIDSATLLAGLKRKVIVK